MHVVYFGRSCKRFSALVESDISPTETVFRVIEQRLNEVGRQLSDDDIRFIAECQQLAIGGKSKWSLVCPSCLCRASRIPG